MSPFLARRSVVAGKLLWEVLIAVQIVLFGDRAVLDPLPAGVAPEMLEYADPIDALVLENPRYPFDAGELAHVDPRGEAVAGDRHSVTAGARVVNDSVARVP